MAPGRGSARRGHGASSLRREIAGAAEEGGADLPRLEGAAGGGRRVRPQEQEVSAECGVRGFLTFCHLLRMPFVRVPAYLPS